MYHFVRNMYSTFLLIFSFVNVLVRRLSTIHSPLSLVTQFKNLMGGILESASPTTFFFFLIFRCALMQPITHGLTYSVSRRLASNLNLLFELPLIKRTTNWHHWNRTTDHFGRHRTNATINIGDPHAFVLPSIHGLALGLFMVVSLQAFCVSDRHNLSGMRWHWHTKGPKSRTIASFRGGTFRDITFLNREHNSGRIYL